MATVALLQPIAIQDQNGVASQFILPFDFYEPYMHAYRYRHPIVTVHLHTGLIRLMKASLASENQHSKCYTCYTLYLAGPFLKEHYIKEHYLIVI